MAIHKEPETFGLSTRVSMEGSNYMVSWLVTYLRDLQPGGPGHVRPRTNLTRKNGGLEGVSAQF